MVLLMERIVRPHQTFENEPSKTAPRCRNDEANNATKTITFRAPSNQTNNPNRSTSSNPNRDQQQQQRDQENQKKTKNSSWSYGFKRYMTKKEKEKEDCEEQEHGGGVVGGAQPVPIQDPGGTVPSLNPPGGGGGEGTPSA